jgi:DNA-directed RNA polymerase subunit M/transcription elongation factor TFIIS
MSKGPVQCILLTQKAEVKQAKLPIENGILSLQTIQKTLKKKDAPELIGTYTYKQIILSLFGYKDGKAGTENKHELPPPFDNILLFGDALLIASQNPSNYTKPVSFKTDEYEVFYTKSFGGFDDIDSEDSDDSENEEEIIETEEVKDDEVEEEFEEEEEEEESEEDEEEEVEEESPEAGMAEFEAAEEPQPRKISSRATKKKKVVQNLLTAQNGSSQILHVPLSEHLQKETTSTAKEIPIRMKTIEQIKKILASYNEKSIKAEDLEKAMYNATIHDSEKRHVTCHWKNLLFVHLYETKVRHILGNVLPQTYVQNKKLIEDIQSGKFSLDAVCELDTYSICNERWKDYLHRRQQREKRQLEGNRAMATDQFLCTRCHKRECTYYELQTRSADEPMTIFITCINCGKHWRQ